MRRTHTITKGMGLIEVLIGSAIITVGLVALSSSFTGYIQFAFANDKNVQAAYMAEEGLESVSFLRDKSWSTGILPLSTTTTYYISWNGSYWQTTASPVAYVDGFLRTFSITDVKRDGTGKIASSGGTYDPNTKKVTVNLSYYQGHSTTTQTISTYISNIYAN